MSTSAPALPGNGAGGANSLYGPGDDTLTALDKITSQPDEADTGAAPSSQAPPETTAPASTPAVPSSEGQPSSTQQTPQTEPWLTTAPKELQALLAQANVSKETKEFLKAAYQELTDYREFGKREDVKSFRELFPNGMEEVKGLA